MDPQKEIDAVLQKAVTEVKAANDGALGADELVLWLAAEIVARDRTLSEAGKVIPERIAANLDMDSRRREVALRAECHTLEERVAKLSAAVKTAIDDAYDARSMMAAGEHVGARSTLWDSCKAMEASLK